MIKSALLVLPLLAIAFSATAQNTYIDYKVGLKLYNRVSYEEVRNSRLQYTTTYFEPLHLSPAVQWRSQSGNFHELELSDLSLGLTETVTSPIQTGMPPVLADISTSKISVRYEYTIPFRKAADHKLVPAIGFAFNPYYQRQRYIPMLSDAFSSFNNSYGVRTFVVPRVSYYFNSRLFADFNVPICIADSQLNALTDQNPNIPHRDQHQNNFEINGLPLLLSARIGVGVRL